MPTQIAGIDTQLLNPQKTWKDPGAYVAQANHLIQQFNDNFKKFNVPAGILEAGPSLPAQV